jgi:hypothetical protein
MFRREKFAVIGVLTGVLLLSSMWGWAIAQVVVPWDATAYNQMVSADSPDTIPPGTKITMQNWQKYSRFMPVGLQQLWQGQFFWKLPADAEIDVAAGASIPLPKKVQRDTEKYSSQVKLLPIGDGGYKIQGYVAGIPFPNPTGDLAGVQILYNEYYAYIPYLITTYAKLGLTMDRFGNKVNNEVREVNFKVKHLSDAGKPVDIPNTGDLFITQNNIIWTPEQSKYVNALQIFYNDPGKLPETFVFVPALRRSLRTSTAARCSPLLGSDYTEDDERSMNLQPPIFQAKFIGYKKLLILAHPAPGYIDETARYGRPTAYYWPLLFPKPAAGAWELRNVAVLDVRRTPAHATGYCYGSRMAFIDRENWQPIWMDLYDANLKLWKVGPSIYRPMPLPGTDGDVATGGGGPGDGEYTYWDLQNSHITFDIQSGAQINENAPKTYDDFARWGTPAGMQQVMQ